MEIWNLKRETKWPSVKQIHNEEEWVLGESYKNYKYSSVSQKHF